MVEQARPYFSEVVRENIALLARELAIADEATFIDYATAKGRFALTSATILHFAPINDETAELARKLNEDVMIMEEVMRQSQAIRQLMGLDPYYNRQVEKGKIVG